MKDTNRQTYAIVLLAMLLGTLIGLMSAPHVGMGRRLSGSTGEASLSATVERLLDLVETEYVDTMDRDSLEVLLVTALLENLDPHSVYLTAKESEHKEEMINSNFEGIGLGLFYYDDTTYVDEVFADGPAQRAGLLPGDRIVRVDTLDVVGKGFTRGEMGLAKYIRGPRGTYVKIVVQRGTRDEEHAFNVVRDVIFRPTVVASLMLDETTGYIRISHFSHTTGYEMRKALAKLLGKHMRSLILDLRDNGGGALESALEVAQELLPEGDKILYTAGAHQRRREFFSDGSGLFVTGGLTVMIDEGSASASEIVAGAVQDNDRGQVVGRRSFGKGLVQTLFEMPGGALLTLTTARYYTPSGRCIQRPYGKTKEEYYSDYLLRMLVTDSVADELSNTMDTTQVFLTKNGRKVYGGGGIQPDVVIDYERGGNWKYYNEVVRAQVVGQCAMDYVHRHGAEVVARYPGVEAFAKGFVPDEGIWQALLKKADGKGIARDAKGTALHKEELLQLFKAHLAQSLYGEDAYYRVFLKYDSELQRARKFR